MPSFNLRLLLPFLFFISFIIYSSRLVCRCAIAASKKGYVYFGIQFYGECWSSADADSRFHMYGATNNCVNTDYNPCDDQASNEACAGANHSNYVYEIVKGTFLIQPRPQGFSLRKALGTRLVPYSGSSQYF